MDVAVESSELFERDKGDDGRGSSANEGWCQSVKHPHEAFGLENSSQHDWDAVVVLDGHQASFEDIERAADKCRHESSETARGDMCWYAVGHRSALHEFSFDHIIASKLCSCSNGSSACTDPDACEQA